MICPDPLYNRKIPSTPKQVIIVYLPKQKLWKFAKKSQKNFLLVTDIMTGTHGRKTFYRKMSPYVSQIVMESFIPIH